MAHALSVSSLRFDRMSPSALALAVLLHALVILALWWISLSPPAPPVEEAIEVTFEQPKPEPPPPPPPPEPARQLPPLAPPVELGLRPPAPLTSDKPTQVPPASERPDDPPAPPPPPLEEALPSPEPQPTPPTPTELAKPAPSVPMPKQQPPGAQQEQALAAPQPAKPPPPQPQRPELRPSPLTTAPPRRPPAGRPADKASRSPFVNPADTYNRARVADNYLWQVVRRLVGYRYQANVNARQGITVVRVVIARDGRLLDVDIAQSSGYPEFDRGVLAGVRAGSPYDPLPPEIRGDSATFNLPLVSVRR